DKRSSSPGDAVPGHVRDAVREAGWYGVTLPRTRVSDYTVHPVITIDQRAWADRMTAGQQPELDRSTLALWEAWTDDLGASPPRPAVSIVGFVSTTPGPRPRWRPSTHWPVTAPVSGSLPGPAGLGL
ncbi:hypothetical protein, partial [Nocardia brevicatena]|uniref:hypothetical protein n=1 Tax=Nocardia brevicatena TaxID=37327 RepID=UPI0005943E70